MPQLDLEARHLDMLLKLLAVHVPQAEVWAFGSRVNGTSHEGSDLDLVLRNPRDLKMDVEGWSDLKEALQESMLPMLVDVHEWAHLPESFHREIEKSYVAVQQGKSDQEESGGVGI